MPEFHLDKSGAVAVEPRPGFAAPTHFADLSYVAQGYIEALFFTETEGSLEDGTFDPENGSALPEEAGFSSLSEAALTRILADVARFEASPAWQAFEGSDAWFDIETAQAGRDLWYSSNGHGCGFWDGDWPEPHATALDAAAQTIGERYVYWCDGKTHLA